MRTILATTLILLSTAAISCGGEVEEIRSAAGRLAGATAMYNGKVAPGYFTNTMTCAIVF